ncbi:MAG: osmotically inducible protein C, partial [Candidatus Cloacimonas sp. 4484_275]
MTFDAELNGHHFIVDAEERVGGRDLGPRPKGLVLSALAG